MPSRPVRVFISYSHDSTKHRGNVLKLCNDLRGAGVDAWIDRYESPPAQGWPLWMQEQIEASDFVLIVITADWSRRAKGKAPKNVGLGARWEGRLIAQRSYESETLDKFIPVFWGAGQKDYIPLFLKSTSWYDLETPGAFEDLYRRLTSQPDVTPPPLGPIKTLPGSLREEQSSMAASSKFATHTVAAAPLPEGDGIDVLVFTPLHEEREAFLRKLQDVRPVGPTRNDVFSYHLGALAHAGGSYRIAIAMPLQMGTRDAATVAARAIDHWQPRYVLLVGIAGAVRQNGAKLGDVIIADSILDYELQKLTARKDEMRPRFYPVDPGLLSAAQTLVADDWFFGVTAVRPGQGTPAVHTGLVASGDKVFARSSALAGILKSYPKLLGVEMEAAGAARAAQQSAVPPRVFMVRSASDFADSKKDTANTKSWREYACDVAASFAAALLRAGALIPANGHSAPRPGPEPGPPPQVEVGKELRDLAQRKRFDFDDNAKRYGFWAERLQATKRIRPDGSSTLSYRVEGLNTKIPLKGFRFTYKSGTGIVGSPVPDEKTRLENIGWAPEEPPPSEPLELKAALESVCKAIGAFEFVREPDDPPFSWSWDVEVLNGDATTEWEFLHLYTKANRKHFDKNDLRSAMEYFARVVWMPAKEFVSIVELPESMASVPRLSVFNAGVTQPPVREVVNDQVVLTYPRAGAEWRRDAKMESLEAPSLKRDGRTWTARIEHPPMGYAYSIDWALPKAPLSGEGERLVRKAEAIRTELLRYRKERRNGEPSTVAFQEIGRAFSSLDEDLRREFEPRADREVFDVYFMTYFREELALKIIDGLKNGKPIEDSDWEFSLPFGLGLAGAAFKAGKPFAYRRPLDEPEGPDYYVAVKGSNDHTVLIAVPLDHPELGNCSKECELRAGSRCQQLIGVLNIGSNYVDSKLLEIAPDVTTSEQVLVSEETKKRIQALKARCRKFAADVTAALAR